jgi:cytochrome c peroxidase
LLLRYLYIVALLITSSSCTSIEESTFEMAELGQALFFDTNLSLTRNQSCSSCHEPGAAFSDNRANIVGGAVSIGDDSRSLGDRNTPSIAYADQVPNFHVNQGGEYVGGLFLDGRSATQAEQAQEPFLNPVEMAMPNSAALVDRIRENPSYVASFSALFGRRILDDPDSALTAIGESIATFERSDLFSSFDSKYDRFIRGEYVLSAEEELGRMLFFSQLISCHGCHLLDQRENTQHELFTDHTYHNIGLPVNDAVRARNGVSEPDVGLLGNPRVDDSSHAGKFRVPSLRNVAVTAPYMHNGVFQDLETAILFYDKFLLSTIGANTNPETSKPWGEPEVAENIELNLLQQGQPITPRRASALAAFLRALTDERYESLLEQ